MGIFDKIANYKQSVKYHKLKVQYNIYTSLLKLLYVKIVRRKTVYVIILPEHIGDVIAFTPFAERVKIKDKNAFIAWLINPKYFSIIENNGFINYCIPIYCDAVAEYYTNNQLFKITDVRFNGNNFCNICSTNRKYQTIDNNFNLENYYEYGSLLEIFSNLAGDLMRKEDSFPKINIPESTISNISKLNLPESFICIHTSSNDENREWLYEKWRELIFKIFENLNIKIVQVGLKDFLEIRNENFIDLCGKLSLIETAEVINRSKLFIGIDSGPAHMANALGIKSVILLGKYRKITNYMPFSGNFANGIKSKIIYNPEIRCSEIEVNEVYDQLQLLLNSNE
ncbi:MAG: glycosyltransferase family 9 protein [Bacteroidota bacterium]